MDLLDWWVKLGVVLWCIHGAECRHDIDDESLVHGEAGEGVFVVFGQHWVLFQYLAVGLGLVDPHEGEDGVGVDRATVFGI